MAQSWGASNIGSVNQLECHKCTASVVYKPFVKNTFFNKSPPLLKKTLELWILWIYDPFLDLPKKITAKYVLDSEIRIWIFPKKTHP